MAKANAAARALDRIERERPGRPDYPYAEVAHGRFRPGGGEPGERPRGGAARGSGTALRPPRLRSVAVAEMRPGTWTLAARPSSSAAAQVRRRHQGRPCWPPAPS